MALSCANARLADGRFSARSPHKALIFTTSPPTKRGMHVQARHTTCTIKPDSASSRRASLLGAAGLLLSLGAAGPSKADEQIQIVADDSGFGKHAVRQGDLVLVHYTGSLEDGQVFDSTQGGLKYRDGGAGVFRPAVLRLSGYPQPGICLGLQQALEGMTIGGRRTVKVPAALGFGDKPVLAPYAMVPAGSTVQYEIELLRVSSVGPDLLVKGISRCGAGGAGAAADGCRDIQPAEFF